MAADRARAKTLTTVVVLGAICAGALLVGAKTHGTVRVAARIVAGAVLFGLVYAVVAVLLTFFAGHSRKRSTAS